MPRPNETTDVNSDARRNDALIIVARTGSSQRQLGVGLAARGLERVVLMMSACT